MYDITSDENEMKLKILHHITHSVQQHTIWCNPWATNAIQITATKYKTMECNNIYIIPTNTTLCQTDTIQCNDNYTINQMDLHDCMWLCSNESEYDSMSKKHNCDCCQWLSLNLIRSNSFRLIIFNHVQSYGFIW